MRKFLAPVVALALVGGCATSSPSHRASPPAADSLRLTDLTGEYDRIAAATATLPDAERIAAFEAAMTPLASGFYARARMPTSYDQRVLGNLKEWPAMRDRALAVSKRFADMLAPARASFEREFGPVRSDQPVYLLHSLGEMDGGTRELDGKDTLLFGADGIVKYHGNHDLTPFFHHELFHLSHEKPFGICEPLWCSLWEEGLATHVAATLNPQAGDGALLLDLPRPIRPAVDADRAGAVCTVAALLDSDKEGDYAALFYGNRNLAGWPPRMGYYVGYLALAELGKAHSLKQLAGMKPAEARTQLQAALARLATCPGKASTQ